MRPLLVIIKVFFNLIRPHINVFNILLGISPLKAATARLLGSVISPTGFIKKKVILYEPAWLQINSGSGAKSIELQKDSFLLIDHHTACNDLVIVSPTILTSKGSYSQLDRPNKTVTISIDLEGGVGLSHVSPRYFKKLQSQWNSYETAFALHSLFNKYSLPVTWAICGHLFLDSCNGNHGFDEHDWYGDWFTCDPISDMERNPDWYMPDFVNLLKEDKTAEIAYHSFGHFNYLLASEQTILKDLQWAEQIRKQYDIPLKTLIYPYNAVSHIEEALKCGFNCFRGYIGQYYQHLTVDFGTFTFYGTSMFVGPSNIKKRVKSTNECIAKNFNYFLHPENWVGCSLDFLERWCEALLNLREKGQITINILGTHENK
jgi:hypothetical protein